MLLKNLVEGARVTLSKTHSIKYVKLNKLI